MSKAYAIICELVKDKFLYTSQPKIKNLLPIDMVFHSYGAGGGIFPIVFEPHKDYGEGYEKRCNADNNEERIAELNSVNEDIEKYNAWARKREGELFKGESLIATRPYPKIGKYPLWKNSFRIAKSSLSSLPADVKIVTIDDEQLYHLKEELEADIFVQRFNAGVFAYIQDRVKQEKDLDAWGEDSVWYNPNKEFVHWFSSQGLDVSEVKPFVFVGYQERHIHSGTWLDLAIYAEDDLEMGEYENIVDARKGIAEGYWYKKEGVPATHEKMASSEACAMNGEKKACCKKKEKTA
jgi:hypothetical protein